MVAYKVAFKTHGKSTKYQRQEDKIEDKESSFLISSACKQICFVWFQCCVQRWK